MLLYFQSSQANGVIEAPSISRQDLSIEETRLYVEILMTILHLEGLSADEKVALCSSLRSYHIGTSISTFDTTTSTESSALPSNNEAGIGFVFTPIHGNLGIDYPFNRGFNKSSFGIDA